MRQRTSNIPRVSAGHFPAKQYTLNIYIYLKNLLCVPLGFIFASFFNFLNCLAHNACALTCSSKTILGKYLKPVVSLAEDLKMTNKKSIERQSQTHFHLVHYADAPFRSYEDRLTSNVWQAAMRLRKHKVSDACQFMRSLES